jgi:hypothetical protein
LGKFKKQGTPGKYYKFDVIASVVQAVNPSATNIPLVLMPEDGKDGNNSTQTNTCPALVGELEPMIDDCLDRLSKLKKPSGASTYLAKPLHAADIKRLFLMGHSGGGGPLFHACLSSLVAKIPTTLVVFDATYGKKTDQTNQFAAARGLGLGPADNRAVIVYTPGKRDDGTWQTRTWARDCYSILNKACLTGASPDVMPHPSMSDVDAALGKYAVICIETGVPHDNIPQQFYPRIVAQSPPPPPPSNPAPSSQP